MKKEKEQIVIVNESHTTNKEVGRNFYRWIYGELEKIKGEEEQNGKKNESPVDTKE